MIQMTGDLTLETMEARRNGTLFFKCWEKRTVNPEFYAQWKYSSGMKVQLKQSQIKQSLGNLYQTLKGLQVVLQAERKW